MTYAWKSHWNDERVDMGRCRASVADGGRSVSFHQCLRKGVIEEDGMLWCKQHTPSAEKKRQEEAAQKYREWAAASTLKYKRLAARNEIADLAVKYFRQQATLEELEQAVARLEALTP